MALQRRRLLCLAGCGIAAGLAGCTSGFTAGAGHLKILSANPESQTLALSIAPEYDAESVFSETVAVEETETPIEREAVVTGRDGEEFFVRVRQETAKETYETVWGLSCAGTEDREDQLTVVVTEDGTVRFSRNRCAGRRENSPPEPE